MNVTKTQCELHGIPADMFISIEEIHALEVEPVRAYEPLWVEAVGDDSKQAIDYRTLLRKQRPRAENPLYL